MCHHVIAQQALFREKNYAVLAHLKHYKRASLACAARLADTSCPPEAPFCRLGSHWLIIREIHL